MARAAAARSVPERVALSIIVPMLNEAAALPGLLPQLAHWRTRGCEVVLVDGGSTDGSVNLLTLLDIDFVKIDGSLIEKITTSKDLEIIVNTIANFSKEFKVKTVAEYVSNEDIYNKIKELNIDYCQGYYFDRPLSYDNVK